MSGGRPPAAGDERRRPLTAAERQESRRRLAGGGGLCPDCRHLRLVRSARSSFARCALAESDPSYRRYPRLPVLDCAGFRGWDEG